MSNEDLKIIKVVEEVFEKKLKEVVTIFQTNQPTETSRVTGLIKQELEPIKAHLEKQDKEFGEKFSNIEIKLNSLEPVGRGVRFFNGLRDFASYVAPYGILGAIATAIYKLFK